MKSIRVIQLGVQEYGKAHRIQQDFVDRRARGEVEDTLLLVEHPPVITLGRGTCGDVPRVDGIPVHPVARGGAATYHGPGQVVAYPIVYLDEGDRDLHKYLRDLEEAAILTCGDLGVETGRKPGHTGVWVHGEKKISSVGVAVRRWVTYHGLALNVDVDLTPFRRFRPCGLDGSVMTSLAECGVPAERLTNAPLLVARHLATVLGGTLSLA